MSRRFSESLLFLISTVTALAAELPVVSGVQKQPLAAHVRRLQEAMDLAGSPLNKRDIEALESASSGTDDAVAFEQIQRILDPFCLFGVQINAEMRLKVAPGPARPELVEKGWRQFLVKVINQSGTTAPLHVFSEQSQSVYAGGAVQNASDRKWRTQKEVDSINPADLWLDLQFFDREPLLPTLSGLPVEYRILSLYSRDAGARDATFSFDVGQGTQDAGFRAEAGVLFTAAPAREITLLIEDEHGRPTTGCFVILDRQQRVHPSPAKRLAPDFGFQRQVYRSHGEKVRLPDGDYTIDFSRGPESVVKSTAVRLDESTRELRFKVERWIDPAALGWWSGDHHIHAAGCAHYTNPTEGVHAPDMARHCLGEDLKVGANLTWGPCFDYQKQFFTGQDDAVSSFPYILHYDIEVSGFGSHQSGHLCLLRLREQMYPGGTSMHHWPTLGLNTLRWAKRQGALCGPAHSGWGLKINEAVLPSLEMPRFDGIGANEFIVDVTHDVSGPEGKSVPAIDFLSMVDTPSTWELNIWYHILNVGFRTRISGETDFPCVYGERVGLGRSYVKLPPRWTYEDWCEGIRAGRNYVTDGSSHLLDFQVNETRVGEEGSELHLAGAGPLRVSVRVAARLAEHANDAIRRLPLDQKPYWHLERARLGPTREVQVEVVVNGKAVAARNIVADGKLQDLHLEVTLDRSSWVAMRILPSSHTNPIFVVVEGQPIRASRASADWCRRAVEQCWSQKSPTYAETEKADARAAYDHARSTYDRLIAECAEE